MSQTSTHLPRRRDCARVARQWVTEHVGTELARQPLQDLLLVVTELVNNAYLHGEGQITLRLDNRRETVRVEVVDEGKDAVLHVRRQKGFGPGGHGLRLVDALSNTWGAFEGTTHVWAELPRSV